MAAGYNYFFDLVHEVKAPLYGGLSVYETPFRAETTNIAYPFGRTMRYILALGRTTLSGILCKQYS